MLVSSYTKTIFICLLVFLFALQPVSAVSPIHLTSRDGLMSSSVTALAIDANQYLWVGTCDGLHRYDGHRLIHHDDFLYQDKFIGNIIERITPLSQDLLCIQTNSSLELYNTATGQIQHVPDLGGKLPILAAPGAALLILTPDYKVQALALDHPSTLTNFHPLVLPNLPVDAIISTFYHNNICHFVARDGQVYRFVLTATAGVIDVQPMESLHLGESIVYAHYDNSRLYTVNAQGEITSRAMRSVQIGSPSLLAEVPRHLGITSQDVSDVRVLYNKVYCAFGIQGAYVYDESWQSLVDVPIFQFLTDLHQHILWIASDGEGVWGYYDSNFSMQYHRLYAPSGTEIKSPVRALYAPTKREMWVGTKGNGLLQINQADVHNQSWRASKQFTSKNSALTDERIYCIKPHNQSSFWVGSESGLYYMDSLERLHALKGQSGLKLPEYIHDLVQVDKTNLWLASVGQGMVHVQLRWRNGLPEATAIQYYTYMKGDMKDNFFFALHADTDSTVCFANRGHGLFRMHTSSGKYNRQSFAPSDSLVGRNDLFCISSQKERLYLGSALGLLSGAVTSEKSGPVLDHMAYYTTHDGLPNATIHMILAQEEGDMWISTNRGLVHFTPEEHRLETYANLPLTEFSDNTACRDSEGNLYFGGIRGLVSVQKHTVKKHFVHPRMVFNDLLVSGVRTPIGSRLHVDGRHKELRLHASEHFFSLSCAAIDFKTGQNYSYSYRLVGLNDRWSPFESTPLIRYTNVPSGQYRLEVRVLDHTTNEMIVVDTMDVSIAQAWYAQTWAMIIWAVLLVIIIAIIAIVLVRWTRLKKSEYQAKTMNQHQKQFFQEKIQLFSTLSKDLIHPLMMIEGPCDNVMNRPNAHVFMDQLQSIKYNAQKLHGLVERLVDFQNQNVKVGDMKEQQEFSAQSRQAIRDERKALSESHDEASYAIDPSRLNIAICEPNVDLHWLLRDAFSAEYNVLTYEEEQVTPKSLLQDNISMVIIDIDGGQESLLPLIKEIKSHQRTRLIPVILISSQRSQESRLPFLDLKVNTFVMKPFEVNYLLHLASNRLSQEADKRAFYQAPANPFIEYTGTVMHDEDQQFIEKMHKVIQSHLEDTTFSVDVLSEKMSMSSRQFYRKVKLLMDKTPNTLIREVRMKEVSALLITTKLSIAEIMHRTGYANKASFYKAFSAAYGMTPTKYRQDEWDKKKENL